MRYKLGKLPVVQEHIDKSLKFADLAAGVTLPTLPSMHDGFSEVFTGLGLPDGDDAVLYSMYGNGPDPTVKPPDSKDGYGDCVMAAFAKFVTSCAALVGRKVVFTSNQVIDIYLKLSKGDNGLNISNTIDYAIKNGLLGEKPLAKVFIDPTNTYHVQMAHFLFKTLIAGIACTDAMEQQFDAGQPWDGSGSVVGGHGILFGAYGIDLPVGKNLYKAKTWGGTIPITTGCMTNRVDEIWMLASQEMVANAARFCPQFAGNLLDAMNVIADQE